MHRLHKNIYFFIILIMILRMTVRSMDRIMDAAQGIYNVKFSPLYTKLLGKWLKLTFNREKR